jgi:hypothetical protein
MTARGQCQRGLSQNQENHAMRRVFQLTIVLIASLALAVAHSAQAAPQGQGTEKPKAASTDGAQATQAKDPNYRFYNGQWWYWIARDKNWMVWTGDKWAPYQPQANRGAVRSFSYAEGGASATDQMFGTPVTGFPNSVANTQILGSYGFRSAGSKAMGNY